MLLISLLHLLFKSRRVTQNIQIFLHVYDVPKLTVAIAENLAVTYARMMPFCFLESEYMIRD